MPLDIPEPWGAFLRDLDRELGRPVELHCLGGFVVTLPAALLDHEAAGEVASLPDRVQDFARSRE